MPAGPGADSGIEGVRSAQQALERSIGEHQSKGQIDAPTQRA